MAKFVVTFVKEVEADNASDAAELALTSINAEDIHCVVKRV